MVKHWGPHTFTVTIRLMSSKAACGYCKVCGKDMIQDRQGNLHHYGSKDIQRRLQRSKWVYVKTV